MAREAASSTKTSGSLTPSNPPPPKRGAFPTPKAEIEKTKPYIPGTDQAGGHRTRFTSDRRSEAR
jgi:hypothetical protein